MSDPIAQLRNLGISAHIDSGKAEFTMEFYRYAPVPRGVQEQLIEEYRKAREARNKK